MTSPSAAEHVQELAKLGRPCPLTPSDLDAAAGAWWAWVGDYPGPSLGVEGHVAEIDPKRHHAVDCCTRDYLCWWVGADARESAGRVVGNTLGDPGREWFERDPSRLLAPDAREALETYLHDQWHTAGTWRVDRLTLDVGSRTQILLDRQTRFPGGDADSFARMYARTLPTGWREGVRVYLAPGLGVVVLRSTAERVRIADTRAWLESVNAPGNPQFEAPETFDSHGWSVVEIDHSKPAAVETPLVQSTGLFDDVFATDGVPQGARVVLQGPPGAAKTSVALEIAEGYAKHGRVIWYATRDEPAESIRARRYQRIGLDRAAALDAARNGAPGLNERLVVLDAREYSLEQVMGLAATAYALFVDPLQKATPDGDVERALQLIEGAGVTTWMTSAIVRGAQRRNAIEASYGGARIENGASVVISLARRERATTVSCRVLKSRYGGEGDALTLTLDRELQRVYVAGERPDEPTAGQADADTVRRVVDACQQARSKRWLRDNLTGGRDRIEAAIQVALDDGLLVVDGRRLVAAGGAE